MALFILNHQSGKYEKASTPAPVQPVQQRTPQYKPVQQPTQRPVQQNWVQSVDQGLRGFSQAAQNVPKFHFADQIQNPVGKFVAGIGQSLANTPSDFVQTAFGGYGVKPTVSNTLAKLGSAANIGLNVASFPGVGSVAKQGAEQGLKQALISGAKSGAGFGAAYGAGSGVQEGQNTQEQLKNALIQALYGGVAGGAMGGALGAGGSIAGKLMAKAPVITDTATGVVPTLSGTSKGKVTQVPTQESIKTKNVPYTQNIPQGNNNVNSVVSYIDKSGKKIYTQLTPSELDKVSNEVKNIPLNRDPNVSQIHLDAVTPALKREGVQVDRNTFINGHPQAKGVFGSKSPLLQEAGKYKSAEEFVKAQALPESRFEYHLSTDGKLPEGKTFGDLPRSSEAGIRGGSGDEVFSSKNPAIWHSQLGYEGLGKTPDNVYLVEVKNPQTTKMQVEGGIPKSLQTSNLPSDVRIIKNLGKVDGSFDAGLFEFKKEKALTDLYNKAQGGAESPLLQEAGTTQRGFAQTVSQSTLSSPKMKALLQDANYTPQKNDALVLQATDLIKSDINKATDLAKQSNDNLGVATASELIKKYQNEGNYVAAADLTKQVAEKLTEAGRTVQAASLYNKLTPEGLLRYAQTEMSKEGQTLQPEQAKMLTDLATQAHKLTGEKQVVAFAQMLNKVHEFIPSKFVDQLTTVWKAGLLTNPTTHIANVSGNTTMLGLETAKDYPAVLLDKFAFVFTGKRTKALPSYGAMAQGAGEGAGKAWTFLKTGVDVGNTLGKIDYKQVNLPIGLKQYTQTIFRALGASDKVFKETLLKKSLHELAVVDGLNQGLTGKKLAEFVVERYAQPTIPMVEQATKDALYGTFNNPNVLSSMINKGKSADSPITRGLTELFAPFSRTPTNIAGRIFDYSPVGIAKGAIQGFKGNQRGAVESLGRGLIGSGIIGAGYGLGKSGQMTGNYPTNPTEQALWQATGKQPGALNVGGNWQSLNRISPVGNLLSIGSGMADLGRIKPENVPGAMLGVAGKNLLGQTYLQGISGALNAFQDPNRYGSTLGSSMAQSVIPSVIGAAARATDPLQRQSNSTLESIQSRIPGLRQQLLPKVDVFGNKMMQESNPLLNPFNTTSAKDTPVTDEINRLYNSYSGATLDHPSKSVNIGQGLKISLTPSEYTAYEQKTGGAFSKILDSVIKSSQYQQASDYDRANIINSIVSNVRKLWTVQNVGQLQNKGSVIQQIQDQVQKRTPNQPFYTR